MSFRVKIFNHATKLVEILPLSAFDISTTHRALCIRESVDLMTSKLLIEDRDFAVLNLLRD